jgi:hypothetical protein
MSGILKLTGHAAWIICVTDFLIVLIKSASPSPNLGSSKEPFSATILVACSAVIKRSFSIRLQMTASIGDVLLVRQNTVVMESSLSSSYRVWAPIEPVAPVKICDMFS